MRQAQRATASDLLLLGKMTTALAWVFAAMAVYFLLRAIALDNRLWGTRRGGAARWNVWLPSLRWWNFSQYTETGAHPRRSSQRAIGFAILCGLLALALSSL